MKNKLIFYGLLSFSIIIITFLNYSPLQANTKTNLKKKNVKIVMWTKIFKEQPKLIYSSCPYYNQCIYTYDRENISDANALIYHYADIKNDLPVFNNKIFNLFLTQESFFNTFQYLPLKLPKKFFHYVVSFFSTSHVRFKYGRTWIDPELAKRLNFSPVVLPSDKKTILANKNRTIFWTVSNCKTNSKREIAIAALKKYINVDIYGKCSDDPKLMDLCPKSKKKCDFLNFYYFVFIGENSICKDYITEKYWNWYKSPVVPIVLNRKIYANNIPSNSFIAIDDFDSPKKLANHLNYLINNPDEYMKHFQWRDEGWALAPLNSTSYLNGFCSICEKILSNEKAEVIPDVYDWMKKETKCDDGSFFINWAQKD